MRYDWKMNIFLPGIMDNQLKSGIHLLHNFGCKINMSFGFFLKEIFDQFYVLQVIYLKMRSGRNETVWGWKNHNMSGKRTQHKTDMVLTLFFNELNIFDWHRVFSFLFFCQKRSPCICLLYLSSRDRLREILPSHAQIKGRDLFSRDQPPTTTELL